MVIKIYDGPNTYRVEDEDSLIEMIRLGKVNKASRVYDSYAGEYRKLEEVEAVKDMAMDVNYNQYLCMDAEGIAVERKKEKDQEERYRIIKLISSIMLIGGIILRGISWFNRGTSIGQDGFLQGISVGAQIFKIILVALVWFSVKDWYSEKRKIIAGVILILISFLYLSAGCINLLIHMWQ